MTAWPCYGSCDSLPAHHHHPNHSSLGNSVYMLPQDNTNKDRQSEPHKIWHLLKDNAKPINLSPTKPEIWDNTNKAHQYEPHKTQRETTQTKLHNLSSLNPDTLETTQRKPANISPTRPDFLRDHKNNGPKSKPHKTWHHWALPRAHAWGRSTPCSGRWWHGEASAPPPAASRRPALTRLRSPEALEGVGGPRGTPPSPLPPRQWAAPPPSHVRAAQRVHSSLWSVSECPLKENIHLQSLFLFTKITHKSLHWKKEDDNGDADAPV